MRHVFSAPNCDPISVRSARQLENAARFSGWSPWPSLASPTNVTDRAGLANVRAVTVVVVHTRGRARLGVGVGGADVVSRSLQGAKIRIGSSTLRACGAVHGATGVVKFTIGVRARPKPTARVLSNRAARVIERAVLSAEEARTEVTIEVVGTKRQPLPGFRGGLASRRTRRDGPHAQASHDDESRNVPHTKIVPFGPALMPIMVLLP